MLGKNKQKKLTIACFAGLLGLCAQAMDTSGDTRGVEECDGSVTEVQGENLECGEDADARGDGTTGNTAIGNGAKASGPETVTKTADYGSFFVKNETTTTETVFRVDPATGRRVEDTMTVTTTTYHWTENAGEDCLAAVADLGLSASACGQITPGAEVAATTDEEAEEIVREALSTLSVTRTTYAGSEPSRNSRNAAFGNDADARGNDSGNVALGGGARAYGHGEDTDGDGEVERAGNIAIGEGADARGVGTGNIAIGAGARGRGNSIAIGTDVQAANGEIAIGHESMTEVRLGAYDLARHSADIETNRGNIATNRGNIATNRGNIATNRGNIATNRGNVATNRANVASNSASITSNTQAIGQNTQAIGQNTQAIGQNTQAIARLDQELADKVCDEGVTEVGGENLACGEDADARGDGTTGNTAIGNGAKASGPAVVTRTLDYDSFFVKNETTTTEAVFRVDPATGRRVEDTMTVTTTTYHWTENAGEDCLAAASDLGLSASVCDQITPGAEIAATTDEEAEEIVREALSTLSVTRTTYARSEPSRNSRNAAFGNDADARGNDSGNVALGGGARAYGHGEDTDDDGEVERAGNIAIGEGADARGTGTGNIAIGAGARARGNSIAIGSGVRAANGEIAIGHESMTKVRLGAYNLARHSADISANRSAIATNRSSISTNRANITANTQAIGQNAQALARFDRGLADVDTRVSQVAAMAAALSAVPNAVPDGKFFVGVGVGGSEGESAVAVGVSGRLGEEKGVHINAGAVASGGEKSVRAGIGWSF